MNILYTMENTIFYDDNKDDEDDDNDVEGEVRKDWSGEFRQRGHVAFIFSHSSMQVAWK